jgi:phosphate transport system substrate-binding protein
MTWRTLLFTVVSLSAASPAAPQQPLRVGGTGSAVAAMARLGAEAEARDPSIRIQVLPSLGSTGAIRAVADGAIDLAVSGRPLRAAERALGIVSREVARTPFLFAVGPRVGATSLTTDDLVAIYRGTLVTWPDGQRIRVVLRPPSDSDTGILGSISPEVSAAVDAAARRPGMLLAVTNTECDEILARSPGSVGPTSLLQLRTEPHPLRPLRWNGVEPTLENLASGRYPLAKPVHLVFREPAGDGVRRFLAFLASPAARALLREMGALPVDFPSVD